MPLPHACTLSVHKIIRVWAFIHMVLNNGGYADHEKKRKEKNKGGFGLDVGWDDSCLGAS